MRPRAESAAVRRVAVRDVMSPDVIVLRDDMLLQEAATLLVENQISGAPVEDAEGRLIGILSYADIARATSELPRLEAVPLEPGIGRASFLRSWEDAPESETLPENPPASASSLTVREVMTPELFSVAEEASVGQAARMMLDAHIHRLLITNSHKIVGILTTWDLLELLTEED